MRGHYAVTSVNDRVFFLVNEDRHTNAVRGNVGLKLVVLRRWHSRECSSRRMQFPCFHCGSFRLVLGLKKERRRPHRRERYDRRSETFAETALEISHCTCSSICERTNASTLR